MTVSTHDCSDSPKLYHWKVVSLVVLWGISTQQVLAQESPLQCQFRGQSISCDVIQDEVKIDNVVLNRGRCEWSIPTAEERKSAIAFRETIPQEALPTLIPQLKLMTGLTGCKSDIPDFPVARCKAAVALIKVVNDPTGLHAFGDKVQFSTSGCDNLLEYTITVDGTDWTWSTR